jgi:cytochrome b6-f complex iron-sulfur subunit
METPNQPVTRRKFIQALLGFSIVATVSGIVVPIIGYLLPPPRAGAGYGGPTPVGKVEDFPVGSGTVVAVNNKPVIIVNTQTGGLKAFSAICTHLGCITAWDQNKGIIHCPCHDGLFNAVTGAVVAGPPPRGLPTYELAVKDGQVLVGQPLGQLFGG